MFKILDSCSAELPTWSIPYIVNDDKSDLTEGEIKMVDDYIKSMEDEGYNGYAVTDETNVFNSHPEFGLPGSTTKVNFYKYQK